MSFNKSVICLGLSVLAFSSVSMAADFGQTNGTVDFTGSIVNTPCTITQQNQNLKVDLGQVRASDFTAKGTLGGDQKQFTIILSNCTVSADKPYNATVTFGGYGAEGDNTVLSTDTGTDTSGQPAARNVGIQISESNGGSPVTLGTPGAAFPITQTEMQLHYAAQYVSTDATVEPGLANGHATFTVAYE